MSPSFALLAQPRAVLFTKPHSPPRCCPSGVPVLSRCCPGCPVVPLLLSLWSFVFVLVLVLVFRLGCSCSHLQAICKFKRCHLRMHHPVGYEREEAQVRAGCVGFDVGCGMGCDVGCEQASLWQPG